MQTIENIKEWKEKFKNWQYRHRNNKDIGDGYPFIENKKAPFIQLRRALPLLNLALISSAGAYIDGSEPFDTESQTGDITFREIPTSIEQEDLKFAARGYDPTNVEQDMNVQIPLARLFEFESNGIIAKIVPAFWSFCGYIPDASQLSEQMLPKLVDRVKRYEAQAALLIPASKLCHQSVALAARALEDAGIATMMLAVNRMIPEIVRPPRTAYYEGSYGSVVGQPLWPEHQRRVLDESLRLLEPIDQPGIRNLVVTLESEVEKQRGEK
jgi:D-proline reductase (dithiol) PrdB